MKLIDFRKGDNIIKIVLVIIALIVVGVCLHYAGNIITNDEKVTNEKSYIYMEQDYISLGSAHIDTLNPVASRSQDVYYMNQLLYSSMFNYDETMKCVPELAEEYTVYPEKGIIVVTLKEGIQFSDGSDLDAYDVVYTVNAIKNAGPDSLYYEKANKIYGAYVAGKHTVNIFFRTKFTGRIDDLVFPIVPSNQYSSALSFARATENFKPIGSGPYAFEAYNPLKNISLVPNENYWGEHKALNSIEFQLIPAKSLDSGLLDINEIVCYYDTSQSRKASANDKNYRVYDYVNNKVEFLVFNEADGIMSTRQVRRAICHLIDPAKVLKNGYMEDGVLTDSLYYPGYLGLECKETAYEWDMDKAFELLEKQNIYDYDKDGKLDDSEENDVVIRILVNENNSTRLAAAKVIERTLEKAGFIVELYSLEYEEYLEQLHKKNFDIALCGYTVQADYNLTELYDGTNLWGYKNDEIQAISEDMNRIHTEEEYIELYKDLKSRLNRECIYYPLCYRNMSLIGVPTFSTGDTVPTFARRYLGIEKWGWAKPVEIS